MNDKCFDCGVPFESRCQKVRCNTCRMARNKLRKRLYDEKHRRVLTQRSCKLCGIVFTPKFRNDCMFCSHEHYIKMSKTLDYPPMTCCICKETFRPKRIFRKNPVGQNCGKNSCKLLCTKLWRKKNPDLVKKGKAKWISENLDRHRASERARGIKNKNRKQARLALAIIFRTGEENGISD